MNPPRGPRLSLQPPAVRGRPWRGWRGALAVPRPAVPTHPGSCVAQAVQGPAAARGPAEPWLSRMAARGFVRSSGQRQSPGGAGTALWWGPGLPPAHSPAVGADDVPTLAVPNWARVGSPRPPASPLQDTIQPERPAEPSGAAGEGRVGGCRGCFTRWLGGGRAPASSRHLLNLAAGGKQSGGLWFETPRPGQRSPCSQEPPPSAPAAAQTNASCSKGK